MCSHFARSDPRGPRCADDFTGNFRLFTGPIGQHDPTNLHFVREGIHAARIVNRHGALTEELERDRAVVGEQPAGQGGLKFQLQFAVVHDRTAVAR